mgnify:CR=1 FL=1
MKKGLSVFALAALLFGVGAVADSNHEVQAKSHSKGGSVKRAKATPVARRAVARPVARRVVAKPVARRAVARPVARRVVAKPVARKTTTRPVVRKTTPTVRKTTTRPVVRKTTPTVRKTATRSVVRKTTPTTRKTATKSVVRKTIPTVKTAVARKATTAKKGTKTAVANKATVAKKGTVKSAASKATAAKKGTKTVAASKATAAKKGSEKSVASKAKGVGSKLISGAIKTATDVKKHFTNEKGKFRLPLHGNYCGPGHGDLTKNPKPVDTLDAICRKHDIGYKKDGYFSRKANNEFVKDVAKNFNKMKPAEKAKAVVFSAAFIAMNNTPLREVSTTINGITGIIGGITGK